MIKLYNPLKEDVKIPDYKKNIILDFFGTMVYEKQDWTIKKLPKNKHDASKAYIDVMKLRPGVLEFLKAYSYEGKRIIHSDTSKTQIKRMLNGTKKYIDGICTGDDYMHIEQVYNLETHLYEPRLYKELQKTCKEYNLNPEETIFLGDTIIDIDSAKKYNIDIIFIPHSEVYPDFNFKDLISKSKNKHLKKHR
jgi:phosphoglycolate phosphatase-like HAD superfamily hydrolase